MAESHAETLDSARLREILAGLGHDATRFRFDVAPNPCVGAAVVSGTDVIARGFHQVWGEAHAEINALEEAERTAVPRSKWDALVVTLEPCSTFGKTPPCVEAIVASGIKTVVVGALDPDSRHRGRGLDVLRAAGLEVILLEGESPLEAVAPHFLSWTDNERVRRPRPWTIAKWAQTRSGQMIPPHGVGGGRWISGPESLKEVQVLRGRVDAIVTGVGTILADDPRFTVRPPGNLSKPPLRVVLDSTLRTPPNATILQPPGENAAGGPVHILCVGGAPNERHRALVDAGAFVHPLHVATDDGVSLRDVQTWLHEQGVRRMLLEAGPRLLAHYLTTRFVDQIRMYTGAVNGGEGPTMASWITRLKLEQRIHRECAEDAVLDAFVAHDARA
ncbi:MAG: bifunctional diaminohydroxyphosphoribosylaminopyrimidine deaminase/5-amino-6-(5-phosphoribosylamino)uracil reductase RibD [Planctomycetota bacterium]|nr:bifunctional diaminohydroxyphosphoribosylaminopyrimidine deaminase/5-amino-6-(5-phosphoribosylamino)uracil reductase RibD [Planctomycetota bacterium]